MPVHFFLACVRNGLVGAIISLSVISLPLRLVFVINEARVLMTIGLWVIVYALGSEGSFSGLSKR